MWDNSYDDYIEKFKYTNESNPTKFSFLLAVNFSPQFMFWLFYIQTIPSLQDDYPAYSLVPNRKGVGISGGLEKSPKHNKRVGWNSRGGGVGIYIYIYTLSVP